MVTSITIAGPKFSGKPGDWPDTKTLHAEHLGEVALAGPIKSVQQFSDECVYLLVIRACHYVVIDVSGNQNGVPVLVFPAPHLRGATTCASSTRCRHVAGAANTDGLLLSSTRFSTPGCARVKTSSLLGAEWY